MSDLSFVRTATPRQDVRVALPAGVALVADAAPGDQYAVSNDGQWIAFVARDGLDTHAAYILNVASPSTLNKVNIPGAVRIGALKFAANAQMLFLLASGSTSGTNRDLFTVALDNFSVGRISSPSAAASADDVLEYAVAPDQSRILLRANRSGRVGLYFVDASALQTEVRVSHQLGLLDSLQESTINLAPAAGGSANGRRVAYTVQSAFTFSTWVADVSASPNPRQVAANARARGFRPDDAALLFSLQGQIYESALDGSVGDQLIGAGASGWYDSTGNIVLLQQFLPSGGSPPTYPALAVAVRGSFGSPQPIGTPVLAAHFSDMTGFDRAIVVMGEGPTTGNPPSTARLALVNAMAPDRLMYLAEFASPVQLATPAAVVVSN
jgi:hypothetical protein